MWWELAGVVFSEGEALQLRPEEPEAAAAEGAGGRAVQAEGHQGQRL